MCALYSDEKFPDSIEKSYMLLKNKIEQNVRKLFNGSSFTRSIQKDYKIFSSNEKKDTEKTFRIIWTLYHRTIWYLHK